MRTDSYLRLVVLTSLVFAAAGYGPPASAALISRDWKTPGDGLLTYDTVSQREWLDLTETQLFKFPGDTLEEQYAAVLAATGPGQVFEGFRQAIENDVRGLAVSADIVLEVFEYSVNAAASRDLIRLLGDPILGLGEGNKWAGGYTLDGDLDLAPTVTHLPSGRSESIAGLAYYRWRSLNGVWLYRTVPEPKSAHMAALTIFWLLTASVMGRRTTTWNSIAQGPTRP